MAFEHVKADFKRNGIGFVGFLKAALLPNCINAILLIRCFIWLEKLHLPTFIPYRILLHIHGFEMGRRCRIGGGLFLPHPRGVILTDDTVVGDGASIYGMVRFLREHNHTPVLGDNVFIGDGARFVGGVKVGDNVTVGAAALVLKDVPANTIVGGVPAKVLKEKTPPTK
jgi:serine O-acetyltransferase